MLFSSLIFLLLFLPAVLIIYYLFLSQSRRAQNIFLLFASLFFYAWGEVKFVFILIFSIFVNWFLANKIHQYRLQKTMPKRMLKLAISFNLALIFIFKYLSFSLDNINSLGFITLPVPEIALPIGISFFTFQAISYVVDVYRGDGKLQKNPLYVGLYIAFFPQLIAGPIVRYNSIANQISERKENIHLFSAGVVRFINGLAKKVILANNFALIADHLFKEAQLSELSMPIAWLGAIAYTFQIYFDFSGYSDMAIGLGKMFGFQFEENFNYPYIAQSTTEFWRRWHISLGRWFRDYVYIPLGGNRVKPARFYLNLLLVWTLTGIWHGANWTFIIWGWLFFVSIALEKLITFEKMPLKTAIKRIYTMLIVICGWVIFRSENLSSAFDYLSYMFGQSQLGFDFYLFFAMLWEYKFLFFAGVIFSLPIAQQLKTKWEKNIYFTPVFLLVEMTLLITTISYLVKGVYNPFIYFNF